MITSTDAARTTLLLVGLLVAGCSAGPSATPTPSAAPSPTAAPPDSNVAVVRIDQTGGMLPSWITLEQYPAVAVYADGRVITPGPMVELYPGPALPNLIVTRVTQAGLAQILDLAAGAGLRGADRMLGEPLLDSGTTNFTVVTAQGRHVSQVWQLSDPGAESEALRQFQDALLGLRTWLAAEVVGEDEPFEWDRLRFISSPADPGQAPDPQLATIVDWPLEQLEPLAGMGIAVDEQGGYRCALVEGQDLDTLRPALATANELTFWRSGDRTYALRLHPLLPDDEPCPGA
jgi:hypothetical protein